MNIHKNARLTRQGRCLLVRRVDELGWQMAEARPTRPVYRSAKAIAGWPDTEAAAPRRWAIAVRRRVVASIALARSGSVSSQRCGDSG
jgi:hypothetical protein